MHGIEPERKQVQASIHLVPLKSCGPYLILSKIMCNSHIADKGDCPEPWCPGFIDIWLHKHVVPDD